MSSEVVICNLALSLLGDAATVSSIDPPEGSMQAAHCAKFYPIARDALLEPYCWKFNTRRIALSLLSSTIDQWAYVYAEPALMLKAISVIPDTAEDDYNIPSYDIVDYSSLPVVGTYAPQPFAIETLSDGSEVICTNQENAVLRYTVRVTDPAKFTPLFVMAFAHLLGSMLAGPVIKGKTGRAEAERLLRLSDAFVERAKGSDASQQKTAVMHNVPWLMAR